MGFQGSQAPTSGGFALIESYQSRSPDQTHPEGQGGRTDGPQSTPTVTLPRERVRKEGWGSAPQGGRTRQAVWRGGGGQSPERPRGCPTQGFSLPFQSRNWGLLFLLSCPPAARNPQVTISQAYKEAQAVDPCVSRPASERGSLPHSRRKKATLEPHLKSTSRVTLQPRTQMQTGTLCAWSGPPRGPPASVGSGAHPGSPDDTKGRSALRDAALNSGQGSSVPTWRPGRAELALFLGTRPPACGV